MLGLLDVGAHVVVPVMPRPCWFLGLVLAL